MNILVNNKDTFINMDLVKNIEYDQGSGKYTIYMTDTSSYVIDEASFRCLMLKTTREYAPFDKNVYIKNGGTDKSLAENKYVASTTFPGGGAPGKSAYDIWLTQGGSGSESDFIKALKGEKGEDGAKGEPGAKGEQGEPGKGLEIKLSYSSVESMEDGYSNDGLSEGDLVIISSNIKDPDNGKVYKKGAERYEFLVQTSTVYNTVATDIKSIKATVDDNIGVPSVEIVKGGDEYEREFTLNFKNLKGLKGDKGEQGEKGATGEKGAKGDPGEQGERGEQGPKGETGEAGATGPAGPQGPEGKSAYDIAKEEGTFEGEKGEFAKALFQMKNIKDNKMIDMWFGTETDFSSVSSSMKENTLYFVKADADGTVTIKTKHGE